MEIFRHLEGMGVSEIKDNVSRRVTNVMEDNHKIYN